MKIVAQSINFINEAFIDKKEHIARCGRICYASDSNSSAEKFYNRLIKSNHLSVLRHASAYYIIPIVNVITNRIDIPRVPYISIYQSRKFIYISTNEEVAITHLKKFESYRISVAEAQRDPVFQREKMIRFTFIVNNGIDITRELNRVSPNNICEQSTRYVDFNKKVGIIYKQCHWMLNCNFYQTLLYKFIAKCGEWFYKISRSKYGLNLQPQDARWCLPLDTMSKAVYTYTVKEWEHIINLRLWDSTGKSHPDVKPCVAYILSHLEDKGYVINREK